MIVQAVKYIEPQIRLAAKAGKSKKEYKLSLISDNTLEKVRNLAEAPIKDVFTDPSYGKVFLFSFSCSIIFNK
jgi:polyribonucleotide nucleotidyltransferase